MTLPDAPVIARDLAAMELFRGLSASVLTDVAARGQVRRLPQEATLFTQGAPADRCHALIAGRVRISQSGRAGGQLVVRFVGPGEMFGTMALFTDQRYPGGLGAGGLYHYEPQTPQPPQSRGDPPNRR